MGGSWFVGAFEALTLKPPALPEDTYSGVTDRAGNAGFGNTNSLNYSINTQRPVASVVVADSALAIGENSLVTITFSEAVIGFTNADLTVENGSLSTVTSQDGGITWTATYTPTAGVSDATSVITLDNSGVANADGNSGSGITVSNNVAIDTLRPTATIVVADSTLAAGETTLVTITFSEAVTNFTTADLLAPNGTLSNLMSSDGGITWTVTLTANDNVDSASNTVYLNNAGVNDLYGNAGTGLSISNSYAIDSQRPTATVSMADTALTAGETSLVTITFSEPVTGFSNEDLTVGNGTLSAVTSQDGGVTWTATFTPNSGVRSPLNLITLDNSGVTDRAGNAGFGNTNSLNYSMNTQRPVATVVVADSALAIGETSLVTITFSEAVIGFTNADLTVENGTLSTVTSQDGGITWTATYTPTAGVSDATSVITLDNRGVANADGNSGSGITVSNNVAIDTLRPTATIVIADTALTAGETTQVTITFSEAVNGFSNADLQVEGGTLSQVTSSDGGITWTATFTPEANITRTGNLITLNNSGVQDQAGNSGTGTTASNSYAIDSALPQATGLTLLAPDSAQTLTWQLDLSEAVSGVDISDFSLVTTGDMQARIASITAISPGRYLIEVSGVTGAGSAQLVLNSQNSGIRDTAGNAIDGGIAGEVYQNHAPTSSGISAQTVAEDSTLSFTIPANAFSDSDRGDSLTYRATLADGSPLPAWITFDAATRTFSGTPDNALVGSFSLRVTATDQHNVQVAADFTLTVTNTNDALTANNLSDITVTAGDAVSIAIPATTFSDVDASDSLTLSATLADGRALPGWLRFDPATGTLSGNSAGVRAADLLIRVIATDSAGASASSDFTLHVLAGNQNDGDPQFRMTGGRPLPGMMDERTGDRSQLTLLSIPVAGVTLPGVSEAPPAGALRDVTPEISALAQAFANNAVTLYAPNISRTEVVDITQPPVGHTTVTGVFGGTGMPGNSELQIFTGDSWQHVMPDSIAPNNAPSSVFGAPVFSMQLKQLNDSQEEQIASLEGALQNIRPSA